MVKLRWTGGDLWRRMKEWLDEQYFLLRVTYRSFSYNSLTSCATVLDTALEPMFWFVDHFVRYLGPAFVIIVICLTTSVVVIFYICLLPDKYDESYFWTAYHLIFGHWLLINIVFHYFKAAFTDPGHPPEKIPEVVSICKKCISPKPPRAHHCSVCDKCILRMDHHCPWLNNCVGFYNHRYFFLFCVYMWVGTVYVSISAFGVFKEHFFGTRDVGISGYFYPFRLIKRAIWPDDSDSSPNATGELQILPTRNTEGLRFHHFIIYEFLLCSAVSFALGLLVLWHARLIHKGETSIEVHINMKEKKRFSKKGMAYKNPYSFGALENWKRFLGITKDRSFWRHVLLPSSHKPDGDGLSWELSTIPDRGLLLL